MNASQQCHMENVVSQSYVKNAKQKALHRVGKICELNKQKIQQWYEFFRL